MLILSSEPEDLELRFGEEGRRILVKLTFLFVKDDFAQSFFEDLRKTVDEYNATSKISKKITFSTYFEQICYFFVIQIHTL